MPSNLEKIGGTTLEIVGIAEMLIGLSPLSILKLFGGFAAALVGDRIARG